MSKKLILTNYEMSKILKDDSIVSQSIYTQDLDSVL